jgi:RNA polymerase sigma-70 factor (ECF subfamily)
MKSPDSKLVVKMRAGDVSAFDSLYWRYYQVVYRNILKLTKDPLVSEDILQEVFIRLWEKRQDINFEQPVVNWIFVISFNLSIDYTRKKLREQELHRKLLLDTNAIPQNGSVYEDYYQLLKRAIEQLSPQKQRIVKLCKLEGMTYEEAAAEMKISRHTVKEYLSAAMASLSEYVRQHANKVSGIGCIV